MIGVLDLQGGVAEHLGHLTQLGVPARPVKTPAELDGLKGLILPGGESSCLGRLLVLTGLQTAICEAAEAGVKLWGTCAGAILLARRIKGEKTHLGLLDITITRNVFGSQLNSFRSRQSIPEVSSEPIPLVFIRAPAITSVGPGVRILLAMEGWIAAATSENVLVTVFHPELSSSLAFHRYFARQCGMSVQPDDDSSSPSADGPSATPSNGTVWPKFCKSLRG